MINRGRRRFLQGVSSAAVAAGFPAIIKARNAGPTLRIAIAYKLDGQFRSFWRSIPHSAELMISGDVCLESMFSPAALMVRAAGVPCVYAAPREGYRA